MIQCRYVDSHCVGHEPHALALAGAPIGDAVADRGEAEVLDRACRENTDALGGAGVFIATNHWSVSIGSTTSPVRPQRGTTIGAPSR